jgi:lipid-binding SYLF domain-containing protein
VEATDLVLVFIERDGLESLLDDGLKLGANASVAAGPVGRSAEASTNVTLDSAIYAYSRSKGVFAGIALDGAVLSLDDSANQKVYGADVDARAILNETGDVPKELEPFMSALRAHTGS